MHREQMEIITGIHFNPSNSPHQHIKDEETYDNLNRWGKNILRNLISIYDKHIQNARTIRKNHVPDKGMNNILILQQV